MPAKGESIVRTPLRLVPPHGSAGRAEERRALRAILDGPDDQFSVLFFHGPRGSGKSTLLRLLGDDAGAAGRHVVRVDCQRVGASIDDFVAAAAPAVGDDDAVLFIDSFEHCAGLEQWLRETFLPDLSFGAVVVIAGRHPPSMVWRADAAWSEVLAVRPLGPIG
jgi:replication-associated recombination protein RarA